MTALDPQDRVVVVGASLAGLGVARGLRAHGFTGEIVMVGAEPHRPYDRPPLSKELLAGKVDPAGIALEADGEDLGLTWRLGVRATRLVPSSTAASSSTGSGRPGVGRTGGTVELADGSTVTGDAVVIATGAAPRRSMPGADLPGVHVLRTLDDAVSLGEDLRRGGRVVVVGGGFIGSEVAATARGLGCDVTLAVLESAPLEAALGPYAERVGRLHTGNGVGVRTRAVVTEVRPADPVEVVLADGSVLPADTVVLGLGAVPDVAWLEGAGLDLSDGVVCDEEGGTGLPGVYAVGDCAAWAAPALGRRHRPEHWTAARERAAVLAARLAGAERRPALRPPYVWSDLYGLRLQLAGHRDLADHGDTVLDTLEVGSPEPAPDDVAFAAVWRRSGSPVAVVALDRTTHFNSVRRKLTVPAVADSTQGGPA